MWTTALEGEHRRTSLLDASIDVLVEPRHSDAEHVAVIQVTIPPRATMPRHDHGESEAVLIPLAGELLLYGANGRVERLQPGRLAVVSAHERISAENPTSQPFRMLVCFAPPTFVDALDTPAQPPASAAEYR